MPLCNITKYNVKDERLTQKKRKGLDVDVTQSNAMLTISGTMITCVLKGEGLGVGTVLYHKVNEWCFRP